MMHSKPTNKPPLTAEQIAARARLRALAAEREPPRTQQVETRKRVVVDTGEPPF